MNHKKSIAELRQLVANQRFAEARDLSIKLTRASPGNVTFWQMRGDLHLKLEEFDHVIECIQQGIQLLSPSHRETLIHMYHVLGTTFYKMRRIYDAIEALDKTIALNPDHVDAHTLRAFCFLLLGDFERGWPEYEYRRRLEFFTSEPRIAPVWDGSSLNGKTITVYAEQGHGDTIQFVRYLPRIKALGANVFFVCQPLLTKLLSEGTGADRVLTDGDLLPFHHVEIPLMSLVGIFHTSLDTIPNQIPYIQPPINAGEHAKKIITGHKNVLRVGLVWKGNAQKTIDLHHFGEMLEVMGLKFFSLQKGSPVMELAAFPVITNLESYLEDFSDTAAAIRELDLVISVDTAVAHLAGALGKPVWTLLPFVPDWRWMLHREDSPWYPTMRLFRQSAPGDWASVIKHVSEELKALVEAK